MQYRLILTTAFPRVLASSLRDPHRRQRSQPQGITGHRCLGWGETWKVWGAPQSQHLVNKEKKSPDMPKDSRWTMKSAASTKLNFCAFLLVSEDISV